MKKTLYLILMALLCLPIINSCKKDDKSPSEGSPSGMIIDHRCTSLSKIPDSEILKARQSLRIAYARSWNSGNQITVGMRYLVEFKGRMYSYSDNLADSVLYLNENPFDGANDLGNPNDSAWAIATRAYLDINADSINVVMWSWGGQVSEATSQEINKYLTLMSNLETDYPDIKFVYMTGSVDGTSLNDNLYLRNEQIRKFCKDNSKILYDFADLESYDPDGKYFGDKLVDGYCNYDNDNDNINEGNWGTEWQNTHIEDFDWYDCRNDQVPSVSINQKAYAAWWLWARIAGWNGK